MSLVQDEDGFYKIRKIDEEGNSYWEGIDKADVVEMRKDGILTYAYMDEDGTRYTSQVKEEDANLLREVKTHVVKVQKDEDIEDLRQRIKELEAPGEQARKDEASLKLQKEGGGVISLNQPRVSGGKYIGSRGKVIYDLYDDMKKGDKDAKIKLDGLWDMVIPHLKTSDEPFNIYACPKCNAAVEADTAECGICGWSAAKSGYNRWGDLR